jgi:hypothetical protein
MVDSVLRMAVTEERMSQNGSRALERGTGITAELMRRRGGCVQVQRRRALCLEVQHRCSCSKYHWGCLRRW